jgi:hypothetical protein
MKVTVPVGAAPAPVTVAVRVIRPPIGEGFCDEVSEVVVGATAGAAETVWVSVGDWLAALRGSPPYVATRRCVPAARVLSVREACPEPFREAVPRVVEPSRKVTVPVGVVPAPVTVAVRVMEVPTEAGFSDEVSDVVVAAGVTLSVRVGDWLGAFRGSPP